MIRLRIEKYAITQNILCAILGQCFTMVFTQILILYCFKQLDITHYLALRARTYISIPAERYQKIDSERVKVLT